MRGTVTNQDFYHQASKIVKQTLHIVTLCVTFIYISHQRRQPTMYTTADERGVLNNFAARTQEILRYFP
jgi:hypothetical protein